MEQIELNELNVRARGIAEEKVAVALTWTASARRLGMVSAVGTVLLTAVYAATLGAGLLSLQSPQEPIGDPWFSILEIVIMGCVLAATIDHGMRKSPCLKVR